MNGKKVIAIQIEKKKKLVFRDIEIDFSSTPRISGIF